MTLSSGWRWISFKNLTCLQQHRPRPHTSPV
jgi:hypothetical protein